MQRLATRRQHSCTKRAGERLERRSWSGLLEYASARNINDTLSVTASLTGPRFLVHSSVRVPVDIRRSIWRRPLKALGHPEPSGAKDVVLDSPGFDNDLCFQQRFDILGVQQLVAVLGKTIRCSHDHPSTGTEGGWRGSLVAGGCLIPSCGPPPRAPPRRVVWRASQRQYEVLHKLRVAITQGRKHGCQRHAHG